MERKTSKLVAAYFDSINWNYDLTGDEKEVIRTGHRGIKNINTGIDILLFFDDDDRGVEAIVPEIASVPEEKLPAVYKIVNELNSRFRWVKFIVAENNSGWVVRVRADALLDMDTCGDECFQLILRLVSISDDAYPIVMKGIWS